MQYYFWIIFRATKDCCLGRKSLAERAGQAATAPADGGRGSTVVGRAHWPSLAPTRGRPAPLAAQRCAANDKTLRRRSSLRYAAGRLLPLALPYRLLRPLGIPTVFPWPWRRALARWAMTSPKVPMDSDSENQDTVDGSVLLLVARKPEAE